MNLRELRISKSLTMKELGKIFQLSESTISMYETGKREPDYQTLIKLADYFGVSVDYLLGREQEESKPELVIPEEYKNLPIAFYDGVKGLSQEDIDDVVAYMNFKKSKKNNK